MLRDVLKRLAKGEVSVDQAEKLLRLLAIGEVGDLARVDVGREVRKGTPEIILAEGKFPQSLVKIALKMLGESGRVIISRARKEHISAISEALCGDMDLQVDEESGMVVVKKKDFRVRKTGGKVGVLSAGTSDIPVAEEVRIVAKEMGCEVVAAYDVGVAGIHRLFPHLNEMIKKDVDVIVVVAGREGALPSVVAGIVDVPVIAVPTSVGYGLGEKGVGALMAMLQACSLGIAVVNIDGGVAAGAVAALIANRTSKARMAGSC